MAIANVKNGTVASSTTGSVTPAFGQATASGHLLVACVITLSGTSNVGASTTATGWSLAVQSFGSGASAGIWYKPNCAASETAPTFTSLNLNIQAILSEWSGADTSAPLDRTGTQATGGAAAQPIVTANSAADAGSTSDLAVMVLATGGSKSATCTFSNAWTPASGTAASIGNSGATKSTVFLDAESYLLNGHGGAAADTNSDTCTLSTGTFATFISAIASFQPPIPAGPPPPLRYRSMGQAVHRSYHYFRRVPWKEVGRGLLVPSDADRRLVVAGA